MNEIELKPCPFCGAVEDLQILNRGDVVYWECHECQIDKERTIPLVHDWFVNCPTCGACGPNFFVTDDHLGPHTDEECKEQAIKAWNARMRNDD